jgi:hypothetical protein
MNCASLQLEVEDLHQRVGVHKDWRANVGEIDVERVAAASGEGVEVLCDVGVVGFTVLRVPGVEVLPMMVEGDGDVVAGVVAGFRLVGEPRPGVAHTLVGFHVTLAAGFVVGFTAALGRGEKDARHVARLRLSHLG